jgi:hypothetical protein
MGSLERDAVSIIPQDALDIQNMVKTVGMDVQEDVDVGTSIPVYVKIV